MAPLPASGDAPRLARKGEKEAASRESRRCLLSLRRRESASSVHASSKSWSSASRGTHMKELFDEIIADGVQEMCLWYMHKDHVRGWEMPRFAFTKDVFDVERSKDNIMAPGEPIWAEPGFLRGRGTTLRRDGSLIATVAGKVKRVNKLVCVRTLCSRYVGEVGDVVICRVAEMFQRRWKVDIASRQDAVLMLSSIHLPSGLQRRRTDEDQLNMRNFYVEEDLISAEVQAIFQDGAISLHTRSLGYGKLRAGVLVAVKPSLMKRLKQHFHAFDFGVQAIFGMNGFVWISARTRRGGDSVLGAAPEAASFGQASGRAPSTRISRDERARVCRVRNALLALDALSILISPSAVAEAYYASLAAGFCPRQMLFPRVLVGICRQARSSHGTPALLGDGDPKALR